MFAHADNIGMGEHDFAGDIIWRRFDLKEKVTLNPKTGFWHPSEEAIYRESNGLSAHSCKLLFGEEYLSFPNAESMQKIILDLSKHERELVRNRINGIFQFSVNEAEKLDPYKFITFEHSISEDDWIEIRAKAHIHLWFAKDGIDRTKKEIRETFEDWKLNFLEMIEVLPINQDKI